MAAAWTFQLCDHAGSALAEITAYQGVTLSFGRNQSAEVGISVSIEGDVASLVVSALTNGIPILKGYRQEGATKTLRFKGHLVQVQEQAEQDATATYVFRDPLGSTLARRFTDASVAFSADDQGQIIKSLIDTANSEADTGVVTTGGTIETTKDRDRTYESKPVAEAIIEMTEVLDGPDILLTPVESGATCSTLNVYASLGDDQPGAMFGYGGATVANVQSVQRFTTPPCNKVRVLGADGKTSDKSDSASIALYGVWMDVQSASDVIEQTTLDDKAQEAIRPSPIRTVSWTADPARCPQPWEDWDLGDTVRFVARRGSLVEALSTRVNGFTIALDDGGREESIEMRTEQES